LTWKTLKERWASYTISLKFRYNFLSNIALFFWVLLFLSPCSWLLIFSLHELLLFSFLSSNFHTICFIFNIYLLTNSFLFYLYFPFCSLFHFLLSFILNNIYLFISKLKSEVVKPWWFYTRWVVYKRFFLIISSKLPIKVHYGSFCLFMISNILREGSHKVYSKMNFSSSVIAD